MAVEVAQDPFEAPDNSLLLERFKKVDRLGNGAFGDVYLVVDRRTNKRVAIKFIARGPTITHYVERELEVHRMLWHFHVIKFQEVFLTGTHLAVVMEYADGGDLYRYVAARKRLSEGRAQWVFQQIIVALDYLHKLGVANRDIKLENVLLTGHPERPLIKLCDMGYAKSVDLHSLPDSTVGTVAYLAPEVITENKYDAMAADIWSCGVLLYVMLVGQYPFERLWDKKLSRGEQQEAMIKRIKECDYHLPRCALSPSCVDLVSKMLVKDPARRATLRDIKSHPWYLENLPAGASLMNRDVKPHESAQSREEIREIVRCAKKLPHHVASMSTDMDDEMNSASLLYDDFETSTPRLVPTA